MTRPDEIKRMLTSVIKAVENVLLHDMLDITVSKDWSNIPDPVEHLEYLRRSAVHLRDAIISKKDS